MTSHYIWRRTRKLKHTHAHTCSQATTGDAAAQYEYTLNIHLMLPLCHLHAGQVTPGQICRAKEDRRKRLALANHLRLFDFARQRRDLTLLHSSHPWKRRSAEVGQSDPRSGQTGSAEERSRSRPGPLVHRPGPLVPVGTRDGDLVRFDSVCRRQEERRLLLSHYSKLLCW